MHGQKRQQLPRQVASHRAQASVLCIPQIGSQHLLPSTRVDHEMHICLCWQLACDTFYSIYADSLHANVRTSTGMLARVTFLCMPGTQYIVHSTYYVSYDFSTKATDIFRARVCTSYHEHTASWVSSCPGGKFQQSTTGNSSRASTTGMLYQVYVRKISTSLH